MDIFMRDHNTQQIRDTLGRINENPNDSHSVAELNTLIAARTENNLDLSRLESRDLLEIDTIKILVSALDKNPNITDLDFSFNWAGDDGAGVFAGSKHLKTLNLQCNFIKADGAIKLAGNSTLETLNLQANGISAAGVKAFGQNNTLKNLNIQYIKGYDQVVSPLFDAAVIDFAKKNTAVDTLDISLNKLGEAAIVALLENTHLRALTMRLNMDVREKGIGEAGFAAILKNTTLLNLDVSDNSLGAGKEAQVERILNRNKRLASEDNRRERVEIVEKFINIAKPEKDLKGGAMPDIDILVSANIESFLNPIEVYKGQLNIGNIDKTSGKHVERFNKQRKNNNVGIAN